MTTHKKICCVCGHDGYAFTPVLWDGLIHEWQLSRHEIEYIDKQQGKRCLNCGCNIRSIALARALASYLNWDDTLTNWLKFQSHKFKILEINEAGGLSSVLKAMGFHTMASYPQVDMHHLPYESDYFDFVVHSDTLEHVGNPIHALQQCHRVLKPNGALCFTAPVLVDRMTRDRDGLQPSYHGSAYMQSSDNLVRTEFGADIWTQVIRSGFSNCSFHTFEYPSGIAILAIK
jgi:SAM-dependent methyltransferase